ncbi:antibiotic biosynthesis monooxygenase family protein [Desulfatitalea alkaliphila]|uniref:Antibiotic biosynthesis monooxygenase n=1 Tax=Desulfatitalea alkaliphila TaxID=2929485 RepID=A0AA41R177_9BACT|nr:antibiotic biosynthesis monooxygenase family protein [Desulfatitalea alkaliphila]MCJ8501002.1 antibiotic biosynthesis monooxygenase [Desulfatitalea alkaliphila]
MTIRVLMTRRIPELTSGMDLAVLPRLNELLIHLRGMASEQPGYISGETMHNVEDPSEYLVIGTWKSLEAWRKWRNNSRRAAIQAEIDDLLGAPTAYKVYGYE